MSETEAETSARERPVGLVRGTRDWLPGDNARLERIEATLAHGFARAGYDPIRIPVLERTDLHERKSGAAIVARLYEVGDGGVCLRPELTAGVVRAYAEAPEPVPLPWRVRVSGPVFRHEAMRPGFAREFHQIGVEMLGASGPRADAEVIWLAWWALGELGLRDATVRIGHVGLILELFERAGLPEAARAALIESLSDAASEGRTISALEAALDRLAGWLGADAESPESVARGEGDPAVDRLFRTLVPDVTGRRSGREVVERLRRKWALGMSLHEALGRLREQIHDLASLRGPASEVLARLEFVYESFAPESVASLRSLIEALEDQGVDLNRVELDLGLGRGIGFYSRMVFELVAPTPSGPIEVGGGGRYDGLARVLGSDRDDRGAGFAFGLERIADVLKARGIDRPAESGDAIYVAAQSPEWGRHASRVARQVREAGGRAILELGAFPDSPSEHAAQLGAGRCVVVRGHIDRPGSLVLIDPWDSSETPLSPGEWLDVLTRPSGEEAPR